MAEEPKDRLPAGGSGPSDADSGAAAAKGTEERAKPALKALDLVAAADGEAVEAPRSPLTTGVVNAELVGTPRAKTVPLSRLMRPAPGGAAGAPKESAGVGAGGAGGKPVLARGLSLGAIAKLKLRAKDVRERVKPSELEVARQAVDERSEFSHPEPVSICVYVDGSTIADHAFRNALTFMEQKSHITVVVISDPEEDAEALPQFKARYLIRKYTDELLSRYREDYFKVVKLPKEPRKSVHDVLCSYVNANHFQLLFVGYKTRRSPEDKPHVADSTEDYSLREAYCTCVVTKQTSHPKRTTYVVGVDGSLGSHSALLAARRFAKKGDRIYAAHIEGEAASTRLHQDPTAIIAEYKRSVEKYAAIDKAAEGGAQLVWVDVEKEEASHKAYKTLMDFAEARDATYLVVGCDGLKATLNTGSSRGLMGSVSDHVVLEARANVIVTQTNIDMEVAAGRFSA